MSIVQRIANLFRRSELDQEIEAELVASRLLAQIVYEATPRDPLVLGGSRTDDDRVGLVGVVDSRAARAADSSRRAVEGGIGRPGRCDVCAGLKARR
jgi:hypothetical protein